MPLDTLSRSQPGFTCLYLACVSCALVYARREKATSWGVPEHLKWSLAKLWYDGALHTMLTGARCLEQPKLVYLQTFCVLTLMTQPFK